MSEPNKELVFSFHSFNTWTNDCNEVNRLVRLCFDRFRDPSCQGLTSQSFNSLLNALFVNEDDIPYHIPVQWKRDLFVLFDTNSDDIIDWKEFESMYDKWIEPIVRPKSALIVVDVQNDFISGSLAINQCPAGHRGEEVIPVINQLSDEIAFEKVVYSQDWHPIDHISFFDNKHIRRFTPIDTEVQLYGTVLFEGPPQQKQQLWPTHCVQNTWGSQLHPNLKISDNSVGVCKGTQSSIDSYSVFWDNQRLNQTNLNSILQSVAITDVFICGLCLDVCVGFTALDAIEYGYRTVIIEDASRGLNQTSIDSIKDKLLANKAVFVNSSKVQNMVKGVDRRPELGFALAFTPTLNTNI